MRILIENRKAKFNYEFIERFEAGIVLTGTEIKSVRQGNMQIAESFVQVKNGKVLLVGSNIAEWTNGSVWNHDPSRTRNLLLHKKEIRKLAEAVSQKGLTIVPIKVYLKNGFAKVEIALAKGKNTIDKRQTIKDRDQKRDVQRILKGKY